MYLLCHLFLRYFPLQPFKSVQRKNKFCKVLNKGLVTKISSTEFAIFRPAKSEHLFRENFFPQGNRILQPE